MDGGGRVTRPLKRSSRPRGATAAAGAPRLTFRLDIPVRLKRLARRRLGPARERGLPRGTGSAAAMLFVLASVAYGAIKGEHVPAMVGELKDARDGLANAVGFRITQWSIAGRRQLGENDVLSLAGVSDRTSLLFLDVEQARARLKASPWIAEAAVRKLYPGRLQVEIDEREPFALWQKDGKVLVIAGDGTVLGPLGDRRFAVLPLVVGPSAEKKAKDFLAVLDRYPALRSQVRASILVADRRWNLKLANGIDIRLPEADVERALDTLVALDRDKKLLTRDITAVDLRLGDRVSVRLSDSHAQAREDALKIKKPKGKGGSA
jgi:cell division protein FtsQ